MIIRDCIFRGTNGPAPDGLDPGNGGGVLAWQSSHLLIESNVFEFIQGFCVRVFGSTNHPATDVRVVGNDLYCLQAEYTENSNGVGPPTASSSFASAAQATPPSGIAA